jgi:hypothetical protein
MAHHKRIAWLNGTSVAVGTEVEVERKAREIFNTQRWQDTHKDRETILTITTYGSQRILSSGVLTYPVVTP